MPHDSDLDAAVCARFLSTDAVVDPEAAFARFAARPLPLRRANPMLLAAILVPILAIALLVATPLGSLARNLLTVFEPVQVQPLDVASLAPGRSIIPKLAAYGTYRREGGRPRAFVADASAASRLAGFTVRTPSVVPPGLVRGTVIYIAPYTDRITFDRRAPGAIVGTTVTARVGAVVTQTWDTPHEHRFLRVVETTVPIVRSSGASVPELERFLLAQPGMTPEVAAQIRAFADPASTLPMPFRSDRQHAARTAIDGVSGVLVGDDTGLGAGLVWQKAGRFYGVFGAITQDEAIAVARSIR